MRATLTKGQIKKAVKDTVRSIIDDYKNEPETDRETVVERLDEECDSLWGNLVKHGRIDHYYSDDLVETAAPCAAIVAYAEENGLVEDDSGLWEGMTFGVLASIAYFSLRNILYKALADSGHDANDNFPFAK